MQYLSIPLPFSNCTLVSDTSFTAIFTFPLVDSVYNIPLLRALPFITIALL